MRTFVIFTLVIVVALGLGYYFGWLRFSAEREQGKLAVGMQVNTDKMKADVQGTKEKVKRVGEGVRGGVEEAENTETVHGTITAIDAPGRRLTLSTADNKELTIQTDSTTRIRVGDTGTNLNELRKGDKLIVVFQVTNGKNLAQTITLER